MLINKNDIIELEITELTGQGSGIGRYEGMAIFVPLTAVGDRITARILKVKKNYEGCLIATFPGKFAFNKQSITSPKLGLFFSS